MHKVEQAIKQIEESSGVLRDHFSSIVARCIFDSVSLDGNLMSFGSDYYEIPEMMSRLNEFLIPMGYAVVKSLDLEATFETEDDGDDE